MNDEARKQAIEKTYEIQKAIEEMSSRFLVVCAAPIDRNSIAEEITSLADISNEVMRLRQIIQP